MPVDDRLVDVGPQRLGRLKLGAVGRQANELQAIGHGEARRAVPASVVEHEQDDAIWPRTGLTGEEREDVLEVALGNPVERYQKLSPVAGETKAVT